MIAEDHSAVCEKHREIFKKYGNICLGFPDLSEYYMFIGPGVSLFGRSVFVGPTAEFYNSIFWRVCGEITREEFLARATECGEDEKIATGLKRFFTAIPEGEVPVADRPDYGLTSDAAKEARSNYVARTLGDK